MATDLAVVLHRQFSDPITREGSVVPDSQQRRCFNSERTVERRARLAMCARDNRYARARAREGGRAPTSDGAITAVLRTGNSGEVPREVRARDWRGVRPTISGRMCARGGGGTEIAVAILLLSVAVLDTSR